MTRLTHLRHGVNPCLWRSLPASMAGGAGPRPAVALADIPKVVPRGYPADKLRLREGAAMDVGVWLKELGLGQYASAFADNDIDFAVLVQLTDADLKELGIISLGHRKRLLAAIAEKGSGAPAGMVHTSPFSEGERRQVTILFADLCGFTALSQSLDPEEVRELVSRYTALVDGIVVGYGGTVDKHIGDAVMALFGAPRAHDDDPMRAVRAALDIHEALTQLSETVSRPLQAHVGIANGEVVAGTVDRADVHDYTVLGDSVNLAARLVAAAGPGQTLISDGVYRALSGRGACDALGEIDLKGLNAPVSVWRLRAFGRAHVRKPQFVCWAASRTRPVQQHCERLSWPAKWPRHLCAGRSGYR